MISERPLLIASRAIMPILVIEFLIGSYVGLFSAFPPHSSANPSGQIFSMSSFWLAFHVVVGFIILGLSLSILALGISSRSGRISILGALGLVSVLFTILMGIEFVLGGYSNNALSYGMSAGFIFSFVLYGALAGSVNFLIKNTNAAVAGQP